MIRILCVLVYGFFYQSFLNIKFLDVAFVHAFFEKQIKRLSERLVSSRNYPLSFYSASTALSYHGVILFAYLLYFSILKKCHAMLFRLACKRESKLQWM